MYFPNIYALRKMARELKENGRSSDVVEIPIGLMKILMRIYLESMGFDSARYLDVCPEACRSANLNQFDTTMDCFINDWFAGIDQCALWDFDEEFYLKSNTDVAEAVGRNSIASGWLHYSIAGDREGRAPNAWAEGFLKQISS